MDDDLLDAVKGGDLERTEELLLSGREVDQRDSDGRTALMLAVRMSRPDLTGLLLEHGADVMAESGCGQSAMEHALLCCKDKTVFQLLLDHGAKLDQDSLDASFRDACSWFPPDLEKLRLLLWLGADPDSKRFGPPSLHLAVLQHASHGRKRDNRGVVSLLLSAGADVKAKTEDGKTALDWAREDNEGSEIIEMLLAAGA